MTKLGTQSLIVRSDGNLSEYGPARSTIDGAPLSADELRQIVRYILTLRHGN